MAVFYKKMYFSSMNNIKYIDDFFVWHETTEEKLLDVSFIPAMMRRRMTNLEKIMIGLAEHVVPKDNNYTAVFASQFGEWEQTIRLIEQFYNDKEMSPAGFSNSVHNAAAGAFSLLKKNTNNYTSIAGGDDTLEMAIMRGLLEKNDVLVVFAGEHCPELYRNKFDDDKNAFGLAMMIKNSGKRKIKITPGDENAGKLTVNQMTAFLNGDTDYVTTKNWTMKND